MSQFFWNNVIFSWLFLISRLAFGRFIDNFFIYGSCYFELHFRHMFMYESRKLLFSWWCYFSPVKQVIGGYTHANTWNSCFHVQNKSVTNGLLCFPIIKLKMQHSPQLYVRVSTCVLFDGHRKLETNLNENKCKFTFWPNTGPDQHLKGHYFLTSRHTSLRCIILPWPWRANAQY